MSKNPLTKAQYSHAVRAEVRWLLTENKPPAGKEENETMFRARLEKSLKESGGYGQLIEYCDDKLEHALKALSSAIQMLIMETLFMSPSTSPKLALTTLEEETTKIINND